MDDQLEKLKKFTPESTLIITADHGNAECMIHPETGEVDKHHTVNPVPFIVVNENFKRKADFPDIMDPAGILADIAPTILSLYNIEKPKEMNGVNLLNNFDHGEEENPTEESKDKNTETAKSS